MPLFNQNRFFYSDLLFTFLEHTTSNKNHHFRISILSNLIDFGEVMSFCDSNEYYTIRNLWLWFCKNLKSQNDTTPRKISTFQKISKISKNLSQISIFKSQSSQISSILESSCRFVIQMNIIPIGTCDCDSVRI